MPGLSARSASKNISKKKQSALNKNAARVEGALTEDLEGYCTYGKVLRCLGHKMFTVLNPDKREHLCHIRGNISKAIRVSVDDFVLLSIRDYETRSSSQAAVYDIIASLDNKSVAKLIKANVVPSWMSGKAEEADKEQDEDIFDYEDEEEEGESESNIVAKKDKKKHRNTSSAAAGGGGGDDIDIDRI
jgi:translation initiation factor IF-1